MIVVLLVLATPPPPIDAAVVEVTPRAVMQGQALRIRVTTDRPRAAVRVTVGGVVVPLYARPRGYQVFAGTSPLTKAGGLTVEVIVEEPPRRRVVRVQVRVRAGDFGVRRLRVPPPLLDPALAERERRRIAAATARPLRDPLWHGPFRRPVEGPVTSAYGIRSIYNGVSRGHHLGVDFQASAGTPVRAAQDGLVVLAERLPLSGNTVMLDHGAGIFTTYQHLSSFSTRRGERVRRGEVVGRVGSTGLSTGPHLHWGMRLHGVRVNPLDWLSNAFVVP